MRCPQELFWQIVTKLPPEANEFPVLLVLTGARMGAYERITRAHLKPRTHVVDIPGTKTHGSVRNVHILPEMWPYVDAAVPAPREYGWLRREWKKASAELGVFDVTLHDLRHCHGQWAINAGAQEQAVQVTLGHVDPGMTRRYVKTVQKGEVATALGESMLAAREGASRSPPIVTGIRRLWRSTSRGVPLPVRVSGPSTTPSTQIGVPPKQDADL